MLINGVKYIQNKDPNQQLKNLVYNLSKLVIFKQKFNYKNYKHIFKHIPLKNNNIF